MKTKLKNEVILENFIDKAEKLGLKVLKGPTSLIIVDKQTNGFKFQAVISSKNSIEYTIDHKSFVRSYISKESAYENVVQTIMHETL